MSICDGPILDARLTDHARLEMYRRQITEEQVACVLANPQGVEVVRMGRRAYQSVMKIGEMDRAYLVRVIVDVDETPKVVVTAYRTSKISKYWSTNP